MDTYMRVFIVKRNYYLVNTYTYISIYSIRYPKKLQGAPYLTKAKVFLRADFLSTPTLLFVDFVLPLWGTELITLLGVRHGKKAFFHLLA